MRNSDFKQKLENLRQQIGEIQQHAEKYRTQQEAPLPEVLENLQNTLKQLQTYDFAEEVSHKAEDEWRQYRDSPEEVVGERTNELTQANHQVLVEISKREQAERELRESEKRYKQLVESVTDYIYSVKVENGQPITTDHGPGCVAVTGYMSQEYKADPNLWYHMIHREDREVVLEQATKVLSGKEVVPLEHRIIHKNGSTRWVKNTPVPRYDEQRHLIAYDGLIADITDRKQAEAERERLLVAEREQRILAETLGEVFLALVAQTSLKAVLDEILHQLHRVISYDAANIVLLEDGNLRIVRWQGYEPFGSDELLSTLEQSVAEFPLDARTIQSQQMVVVPDTRQEPDWVVVEGSNWIRSFVAVPICLHERVLGLLRLDSKIPNNFLPKDVEGLRPLANAAAIALENARLYDQARQELAKRVVQAETEIIQLNRKLLTLQYAGVRLTSSLDLQDVLDTVTKEMADLLAVDCCALFEWDRETNTLSLLTKYGLDKRWKEGSLVEVYPGAEFKLIERVLLERRPQQMIISHPSLYPAELAYMKEVKLKTLLMVPMEFQDRVIGLLQVMDVQSKRTFTNREIGLAQLLGNQMAGAIENTRLYDKVQQEIAERQHAEQEARELNVKLMTLQNAGAVITASLDLQYILESVAEEVTKLLDVEGCALFKWDAATNTISVMTRYGLSTWSDESSPIDINNWAAYPLIKEVITERQAQQITVSQSDKAPAELAYMQWRNIKTLLMLPMEFQDHIVGLIEIVDSRMERTFTPDEIAVVQLLANQGASAVENARLFDNARKELAERMQAENELRRVTAKQQAILDAIPDSMIYLNSNGKVLDYKLDDYTSLPPGISMPFISGNSGDTLQAVLHDLIEQYIDKTLVSSKPQSFEYQLRGPEGAQYFEVRLVASGENEILAILRNITERKQAELALAEERNLLRTVIDNLPDYIFAKDIKGRYLVNNKAHLHLLGIKTPDEAAGKFPYDFFTPEEAERLSSDDQKVFRTGQPLLNKEGSIKWKGGNEIWRSISKVPLRDVQGKIVGLVSIGRDITERRQAEEQLRKLSLAVEQSPSIVIITDTQGNIEYINPKFSHLTGYTLEEIIGENPRILRSGKVPQEVYKQLWETVISGDEWHGEFHNKKKNGESYWALTSISPIKDSEGNITHFLSVQEDITERKQVEEALLRSETNLRAILENSQQAFVLTDKDYTIQAFNRIAKIGIRLISGKTIKERSSVYDYVSETDLEKFNKGFDEALDGRSVRQEKQLNIGDKVKWFEISHNPVFAENGQVIGVCVSAINIDERKRAVEILAASEMRLWEEMRSMLATTRALVSEISINNLLEFIMSQAMALMNADHAAVLLLSEDGQHLDTANPTESNLGIRKGSHLPIQGSLAGLALAGQQIQISNDVDDPKLLAPMLSFLQLPKVHSLLCAPLTFQRTKLGVLLVWNKRGKIFSTSNNHIVEIFADQAALALYDADLHAQNRLLAIEQERHRMARDLHDSVTQSLYSIGLAAQTSMRLLGQGKVTKVREPLDYIHTLSQTALAEMREKIFHLRPTDLDKENLVEVLRQHCHTLSKVYDLNMKFIPNLESLPLADQREALYFIAREALWNVIKHAKAKQVNITLKSVNEGIRLTIEDDGIGLDPSRIQGSDKMGLRNIQERTKLLGGTFDLQSEPGYGTRLTVQIPH